MPANPLRVAIVAGVNPGKWTRVWAERHSVPIEVAPVDEANQRTVLLDGLADIAFVRLPVDRDRLSVIRLYEEAPVVVVPKDHPISLFDAVTLADLDGEAIRTEQIDDAIDLVVAGVGILLVPQSIARQHSRRDLAVRPVTDAPATQIAIAWLSDRANEDLSSENIEEFVGIVRGRTAASSRGSAASKPTPKKAGTAKINPQKRAQPGAKNSPKKPRRR